MLRRDCSRLLALALLLATTVTLAAPKPKVVVLAVGYSEDGLKKLADSIAEVMLTELGRTKKVDAMGTSDVSTILGLEREKQMLGCAETSSQCLAEISALGAPWLVTGNIARLGKSLRVDMKLVRARDGKAVFRDGRSLRDESQTFDVVSEMVRAMVGEMELGADAAVEKTPDVPAPPGSTARLVRFGLMGAGGLALVGGGVLLGLGAGERGDVLGHPEKYTYQAGAGALAHANGSLSLGGALAAAGVLVGGGALAWALISPTPEAPSVPAVSVSVSPAGSGVVVSGAF